jgi:hypothetical protein
MGNATRGATVGTARSGTGSGDGGRGHLGAACCWPGLAGERSVADGKMGKMR